MTTEELKVLNKLIDSWEVLVGGTYYTPKEIGDWLFDNMKPAIDEVRILLNRPIP